MGEGGGVLEEQKKNAGLDRAKTPSTGPLSFTGHQLSLTSVEFTFLFPLN